MVTIEIWEQKNGKMYLSSINVAIILGKCNSLEIKKVVKELIHKITPSDREVYLPRTALIIWHPP